MFKKLVINRAKSYIINSVNQLLQKNKDNVTAICEQISKWTLRLTLIIEQLKKISARASDGNFSDDEVDQSIKEIETLIREWK